MTRIAPIVLFAALSGCAIARPMLADSGDLADYRAFRVASREGARLSRAQHYVEAHPRGEWLDEVREVFDREEPQFFEAAKTSRRRAIDYIVDLPRGPHAAAAYAVLASFDAKDDDFETTKLLAEARRTDAMLERASENRRAIGERIGAFVAALLDRRAYGVPLDDAPTSLRRALGGASSTTWGAVRTRADVDLAFVLPTPTGREERTASIEIAIKLDATGNVVEGRVWGPDLFVRWAEADAIRAFDGSEQSRGLAATHAKDILGGAFEAVLPGDRCNAPLSVTGEVLARRCDGWSASVVMGDFAGAPDVVLIRGPSSRSPSEK